MRKTLLGLGICALTPMVLAGCGSAPTTAIQAPATAQAAGTTHAVPASSARASRLEQVTFELKQVCQTD